MSVPRLIMGNAPSHIRSQQVFHHTTFLSLVKHPTETGKRAFQSKPEGSVIVTDRYVTKIVGDEGLNRNQHQVGFSHDLVGARIQQRIHLPFHTLSE